MASIEKAYCREMHKIVTSSQARVSFLSSENKLYNEYSFYCIYCGLRLSGANVHKREELTRDNKTSHFKKYSKDKLFKHTNMRCLEQNTSTSITRGSSGGTVSSGNLIVYNKFKLSQIDYEVVPVVKHPKTDFLPLHVMSGAKESSIECDIHTTSILKDLVNCFNELELKGELDNYVLNIEGDKLENNNTYNTVFREFIEFNQRDKSRRKLNEFNDNFFKYRVLYGKSLNNKIKKNTKGWSFLIDFNGSYFFKEPSNQTVKPMNVRIFISEDTLLKYSQLKDQYLKDEKDKILDKCFIVNCKPEVRNILNNDGVGTHEELVFEVINLHHLHITFKDSK
ncbi:hypothetical protein [Aliarcobacter butzleri]|uniref:hypothetical protein n=1 Tax=Aliarcobacter butzleri TaxID=28197 RepID=UPI00263D9984|nr:hypothetical protein [Aliarcobacter butzleri]MDN5049653.1 hypothetical protein [Aliarcobacter butzleri]MDN5056544.1 hypothetical protein [Aliarcobacter butzleri]